MCIYIIIYIINIFYMYLMYFNIEAWTVIFIALPNNVVNGWTPGKLTMSKTSCSMTLLKA